MSLAHLCTVGGAIHVMSLALKGTTLASPHAPPLLLTWSGLGTGCCSLQEEEVLTDSILDLRQGGPELLHLVSKPLSLKKVLKLAKNIYIKLKKVHVPGQFIFTNWCVPSQAVQASLN